MLLQIPSDLPAELPSLGVAGLMGLMWLWERRVSQKREQQIDEAHARILADRIALETARGLARVNAADPTWDEASRRAIA